MPPRVAWTVHMMQVHRNHGCQEHCLDTFLQLTYAPYMTYAQAYAAAVVEQP